MTTVDNIKNKLIQPRVSVSDAEVRVPASPGYYSIHINDPRSLEGFIKRQIPEHRVIYVGITIGSLQKRLVEQDLRQKGNSTFFRSMGALLGYRPIPGSLRDKKNQKNYKFSDIHAAEIITWFNLHLSVSWAEDKEPEDNIEKAIIQELHPPINMEHNPVSLPILSQLREECRRIARE